MRRRVEYLMICNWGKFQHYKNRNPPWIKLHTSLLEDYEFSQLSVHLQVVLLKLWLVAARTDNRLPDDPAWIGQKLTMPIEQADLATLVAKGWIEPRAGPAPPSLEYPEKTDEGWGTRYVKQEVRDAVRERDGHKCQGCGTMENIEIDHIIPVSRGGNGEMENLRLLCRSCNRKKRRAVGIEGLDHLGIADCAESATLDARQLRSQNRNNRNNKTEREPVGFCADDDPKYDEQF